MLSGVSTHQSPEDEAEIQALLADESPEDAAPAKEVDTSSQSEELPPKEQPATTETTATSTKAKPPQGDTRAALRASRRAEHRANQENARLREELETARKGAPVQAPEDESLTAQELDDFPIVAKLARQNKVLQAKVETLIAGQQGSHEQPEDTEFQPPTLPPTLQDVVDDIPDLLTWQNNPDQTAFELAKIEDSKLLIHPKWKDKPPAERLAEVARRVRADLYELPPTTSQPRVNVDDAIAKATRVKPNTLGDIGGGGDIPKLASNLGRFSQMSDEDINAELLSG